MDITRARPEQVEAALEVWRAASAARGTRPSAARTARVLDKLAAPDAVLVVAADDGHVAGLALGEWGRTDDGAGELVPGLLHLSIVAVHPSAQRQGLGSALAEGLADAAYVRGARRLSAWARDGDSTAFLTALGLEPTGRQRELDGRPATELGADLDPPLRELEARAEGLRLGQLLKLAGLVDTGAEAKTLLDAGGVLVDGEVERRRGRQLKDGEVVVAHDQAVRVRFPPE